MHTSTGPHVNHVVGGANHVFVVLDHQYAVANVAQVFERTNQAVVVPLVQADAGLIEHVHHPGQARTDLRSQANALGLTARQCFSTAVQTQIVQPHVVQKLQPQTDFPHHFARNLAFGTRHFELIEISKTFPQRDAADIKNRTFFCQAGFIGRTHQVHVACFLAQARSVAVWTRLNASVACQLVAHGAGVGLTVAAVKVADHTFKRVLFGDFFALRRA